MSLFKKKEEKSLLEWTIETDGKYQSQLIDLIAERNDRINKAIEYLERKQKETEWWDTDFMMTISILKGDSND